MENIKAPGRILVRPPGWGSQPVEVLRMVEEYNSKNRSPYSYWEVRQYCHRRFHLQRRWRRADPWGYGSGSSDSGGWHLLSLIWRVGINRVAHNGHEEGELELRVKIGLDDYTYPRKYSQARTIGSRRQVRIVPGWSNDWGLRSPRQENQLIL